MKPIWKAKITENNFYLYTNNPPFLLYDSEYSSKEYMLNNDHLLHNGVISSKRLKKEEVVKYKLLGYINE